MTVSKELFVVRVDDYFPEMCAITMPAIERYAKKIGAKFTVITERRYPDLSPTFEKMQIWELGRDNDYNILLDCDMAIREEMYDITEVVEPDRFGVWEIYRCPPDHWVGDEYLPKSGSPIGYVTNMVVSSRGAHRVWEPWDLDSQVAISRCKRPFAIDEYCFTRNVYRYGLTDCQMVYPGADGNLFKHCNINSGSRELQVCLQEIRDFLSDD